MGTTDQYPINQAPTRPNDTTVSFEISSDGWYRLTCSAGFVVMLKSTKRGISGNIWHGRPPDGMITDAGGGIGWSSGDVNGNAEASYTSILAMDCWFEKGDFVQVIDEGGSAPSSFAVTYIGQKRPVSFHVDNGGFSFPT